jgi:hypothetical protein
MRTTYTVAFYEIDRAYGGPEEGGWWYDCGSLKRLARTFKSKAAAQAYASRANNLLTHIQRDLRSVNSMAYGGGRYRARVYEGIPPSYYPQGRPHYE